MGHFIEEYWVVLIGFLVQTVVFMLRVQAIKDNFEARITALEKAHAAHATKCSDDQRDLADKFVAAMNKLEVLREKIEETNRTSIRNEEALRYVREHIVSMSRSPSQISSSVA